MTPWLTTNLKDSDGGVAANSSTRVPFLRPLYSFPTNRLRWTGLSESPLFVSTQPVSRGSLPVVSLQMALDDVL